MWLAVCTPMLYVVSSLCGFDNESIYTDGGPLGRCSRQERELDTLLFILVHLSQMKTQEVFVRPLFCCVTNNSSSILSLSLVMQLKERKNVDSSFEH